MSLRATHRQTVCVPANIKPFSHRSGRQRLSRQLIGLQLTPGTGQQELSPVLLADHVCNMYLIDESVAPGEERGGNGVPQLKCAVELLFFSSDLEVFPKLQEVGDIIRFHRVKVILAHGGVWQTQRSKYCMTDA